MTSSTHVEQSIDSADSSSKKGSVDELDDFCKQGNDKSLEDARSIHEHLLRSHPHLDIKMYNKILEMYGKCGSMNDAFLVFRKMPQRNLTYWDTMITWLGKNGLREDAIELFGVVGDIVEGMLHFESMSKDYDIVLSMEPYVVSTGYLDEAMEFIERMPIQPSIEVWETMMNLCTIHGNSELAEIVELLDPSRLDEQSKAGFLAVKASE
ncbi:hypothetical protein KY289_030514 [Solanum tuberosum]|uniref:Pentatricopeptide repeat-containing protein, mitochondrial n=1 Tax=Solanum tuberosum TaxID=4113 RepID=M1A3A3_SOLTU|nr:hypothetical protein KY289_030514 [Solanum tuberosum]